MVCMCTHLSVCVYACGEMRAAPITHKSICVYASFLICTRIIIVHVCQSFDLYMQLWLFEAHCHPPSQKRRLHVSFLPLFFPSAVFLSEGYFPLRVCRHITAPLLP